MTSLTGRIVVSVFLISGCLVESLEEEDHVIQPERLQQGGRGRSLEEKYHVIQPERLEQGGRGRSLEEEQVFPDWLQFVFHFRGKNFTMELQKNTGLFADDYTETQYSEDGKRVTTTPPEDHCFYHGFILEQQNSSVSVSVCSGISGVLRFQQQIFFIHPEEPRQDAPHRLYRPDQDQDQDHQDQSQDQDQKNQNQDHYQEQNHQNQNQNHQNLQDQNPYGGPHPAGLLRTRSWNNKVLFNKQRFIELYIVVDNTEYQRFGSETRTRILGVLNHVDQLYRALNLRVLLSGLEIWTQKDLIQVDPDPETTLDHFLSWKRSALLGRKQHDSAMLVTGRDFDGDTVGLANKFSICTQNSAGVNQDHHPNPLGLSSTLAHELAHSLGLSHDADGCSCRGEYCIMADQLRTGSSVFPEAFSSCSLDQFSEFLVRAQPDCLEEPSMEPEGGRRCGNGLLEPPEECDCGPAQQCNSSCCDSSSCRLTPGSRCSEGSCCRDCQLMPSGTVCRPAAGECDLAEFCSGASAACPHDAFRFNGEACFNQARGFCYNGHCPTLTHHCWRLFGPGSRVAADRCFLLNLRGEGGADCGRSLSDPTPCPPDSVLCGSLFCEGGGDSITGRSASFSLSGGLQCRLAVEEEQRRRLHRTPAGARCGEEKVCVDSRCVGVSVYGKQEDCNKKCNNNGVCDHQKECHCSPGWAPPFCLLQYSDAPEVHSGMLAGVILSIFLVVMVTVTVLICWRKRKMENYCKRRRHVSASRGRSLMLIESGVKACPLEAPPPSLSPTEAQRCPLVANSSTAPPQERLDQEDSRDQPPKKPETNLKKPVAPSKPWPPLRKPQFKGPKPSVAPPPLSPPAPPPLSPPPPPLSPPAPPPLSLSPPAPPAPPPVPPKPRIPRTS